MEVEEKQVRIYRLPNGQIPFWKWISGLRDRRTKQKIQVRIARLRLGNFGQTGSVGDGIRELKIDYGPGYRVYFVQEGDDLVILLCGGDKSTQSEDIKKAKEYWANYRKERTYADG